MDNNESVVLQILTDINSAYNSDARPDKLDWEPEPNDPKRGRGRIRCDDRFAVEWWKDYLHRTFTDTTSSAVIRARSA